MANKTFDLSVLFKMRDHVSGPMRKTAREFERFANKVKKSTFFTKKFAASLKSAGTKMKGVGQSMSMGLTAPIVAFGISSLLTAKDFQSAMNMVGAVTRTKLRGKVTPEFETLNKLAKDLGATTIFSAQQVAQGMVTLGLKGLKTAQMFDVLPKVLELATSAQMDIAAAGDIVIGTMNSQKLGIQDLTKVNDTLVSAFTRSSANLQALGESFKYAGAVTRDTGLSIQETAAVLAFMAKMNVDATMAGTALRGGMIRMANPSKQMAKLFGELGIKIFELKDGERTLRPILEILQEFEKAGIRAEQLSAPGIFGMRAGPGFATLLGQSKGIKELLGFMEKDIGIASAIAETQMTGLPKIIAELAAAWEIVKIAFADSKFGKKVEKWLVKLTKLLRGIADTNPDLLAMGATFLGVLAALGPLVILLSLFVSAIAAIAAFPLVFAVLGAITLAAIAMGLAVKFLVDHWDDLTETMRRFLKVAEKVKKYMPFAAKGAFLMPSKIIEMLSKLEKDSKPFHQINKEKSTSLVSQSLPSLSIIDLLSKISELNNKSKTEIDLKVSSDSGSTATVEGVKSKGGANVNVINDAYLGIVGIGGY